MKFFVGVTDYDLYITLKNSGCNEVNFWRPSDYNSFKAVGANDLFLFKLHSPHNFIVGGGYFVTSTILPSFLAWDVFGIKNGTQSLKELNRKILKYKEHKTTDGTINIGCIILAKPFFFEEADWIQAPEDWSLSIVQGKTYDTDTMIVRHLYQQVQERIKKQPRQDGGCPSEEMAAGKPDRGQSIRPELGPGAFYIAVAEAYHRSCSITGEGTLPVLEAAHIRPCSEEGPNCVHNGILMRSDFRALFDKGYLTVDEKYDIDVSRRLKEDYGDGKIYYEYRGKQLAVIPDNILDLPAKEYLEWHNSRVFMV